jgi:hypothetical protein
VILAVDDTPVHTVNDLLLGFPYNDFSLSPCGVSTPVL